MIPGANIRHSSILRQPLTLQSTVRPLFVERKTFVETSSRSGKYLHKSDVVLNEKTK